MNLNLDLKTNLGVSRNNSKTFRKTHPAMQVRVLCGLWFRLKNSDDSLYELPDHINVQTSRKKTEDMLSNQMLSGIPEVDLGIE